MKRLLSSALCCAVLASGCATTGTPADAPPDTDAAPRTEAPAPAPAPAVDNTFREKKPEPLDRALSFEAPVPVERKLSNGLRVLVHESSQLPLVSMNLVILAGVNAEPKARPGLAGMVAWMIDEGTQSRDAMKLAEELEDLAAHLSVGDALETTSISLNSLKETLPQAVELVADVVMNPAFRPADLERVRGLRLTAIKRRRANPTGVAEDHMNKLLYGDHPWGQPDGGTFASIRGLKREDLIAFHRTWYRPNNAFMVVSGAVTPDEVVAILEKSLKAWKPGRVPKIPPPKFKNPPARSITVVDKEDANQSQVWISGHTIGSTHPDNLALKVANFALGGQFSSRLNMKVREEKAYAYGVYSQIGSRKETGRFVIASSIHSQNTAEALHEMESELERLQTTGDVTEKELEMAKIAIVGGLPTDLETNGAIVGAITGLVMSGRPLDYYRTLPGEVNGLGVEQVSAAAKKHLFPKSWPIVVVGPRGHFEQKLQELKLGPVKLEKVLDPDESSPGTVSKSR
jgi:zinc protease